MASDGAAPGVDAGEITFGCGRSGSCTCHGMPGSIGVSLKPRSGFTACCASEIAAPDMAAAPSLRNSWRVIGRFSHLFAGNIVSMEVGKSIASMRADALGLHHHERRDAV